MVYTGKRIHWAKNLRFPMYSGPPYMPGLWVLQQFGSRGNKHLTSVYPSKVKSLPKIKGSWTHIEVSWTPGIGLCHFLCLDHLSGKPITLSIFAWPVHFIRMGWTILAFAFLPKLAVGILRAFARQPTAFSHVLPTMNSSPL